MYVIIVFTSNMNTGFSHDEKCNLEGTLFYLQKWRWGLVETVVVIRDNTSLLF